MWPWGHVAVGYLLYSVGLRTQGRRPEPGAVGLLLVGTLLPDLIDKPLAWTFGVLDSGRSLGHSLVIGMLVVGLLYVLIAPRVGRGRVTAFSVGYLSHPLADLPFRDILAGNFEFTTYLVWPLLPAPDYQTDPSFLAHVLGYEPGQFELIQIGLFIVAVGVYSFDGAPGLGRLRETLRS